MCVGRDERVVVEVTAPLGHLLVLELERGGARPLEAAGRPHRHDAVRRSRCRRRRRGAAWSPPSSGRRGRPPRRARSGRCRGRRTARWPGRRRWRRRRRSRRCSTRRTPRASVTPGSTRVPSDEQGPQALATLRGGRRRADPHERLGGLEGRRDSGHDVIRPPRPGAGSGPASGCMMPGGRPLPSGCGLWPQTAVAVVDPRDPGLLVDLEAAVAVLDVEASSASSGRS